MKSITARVGAYGVAVVLSGGLIYSGFIYESDPDLLTMVSSVEVQLRMASVMPERGEDGKVVVERVDLLSSAREFLDRIDRMQPNFPPACDYRAYLAYLDKDYGEAARLYGRVRSLRECTAEQSQQAVINQARMLRMDGEVAAAAKLLEDHQDGFSAEYKEIVQRENADPVAPKSGAGKSSAGKSGAGKSGNPR